MSHSFAQGTVQATTVYDLMPRERSVISSFEHQVYLRPNATALELHDKALTYAALDARVRYLTQQLKSRGVGRGDVVAICLRRNENLLIGMLAVLKAGAAYLPLNPDDPTLRLGYIVSHASARCTLTDSASSVNLPEELSRLVVTDVGSDEAVIEPQDEPSHLPQGSDLAYVIYTSGTTGAPKGVEIQHGALMNVVNDVAQRTCFTETGSWLAVTTVCFDIAALELLLPLCFGGKVILASEEQVRMGRILVGMLQRKQPTVMQATPITWRILIESGWSGSENLTVLCGGDRLDRDLANKLLARSASVWNMYGPTETTIWSTAEKLSSNEEVVPIGTPIAKTEVYILDQEQRIVPDGESGEICIAGEGLARGYANDPLLTGRSFIHAQIGDRGAMRLYRTGDLGRWNEQGKLEFFGRMDHQVKINGFRVEMPEIEKVLRSYPGITEAAALGVAGVSHQKRLFALVVAREDAEITKARLVAHLSQHLPKYMIPEKFWLISRVPSTPNGKRDVAALTAITKSQADLEV